MEIDVVGDALEWLSVFFVYFPDCPEGQKAGRLNKFLPVGPLNNPSSNSDFHICVHRTSGSSFRVADIGLWLKL